MRPNGEARKPAASPPIIVSPIRMYENEQRNGAENNDKRRDAKFRYLSSSRLKRRRCGVSKASAAGESIEINHAAAKSRGGGK